jgi:hypothetical protein
MVEIGEEGIGAEDRGVFLLARRRYRSGQERPVQEVV